MKNNSELDYYHFLNNISLEETKEGIYFIQNADGYIKIGESVDIKKRITNYKTHSPTPVWLCGYILTTSRKDNEYLQQQVWRIFRVHREWYAPCFALVDYIKCFENGIGLAIENLPFIPSNYKELYWMQNAKGNKNLYDLSKDVEVSL